MAITLLITIGLALPTAVLAAYSTVAAVYWWERQHARLPARVIQTSDPFVRTSRPPVLGRRRRF
ncbi:hypothetical protein ABZ319_02010 [Nocardia sp. NPDC005978]|uniref:hypothetical protein n=1 Tax=Nocardia sp. NPDC005978 TaxID=3156725 RepID=UPI0033B001E4